MASRMIGVDIGTTQIRAIEVELSGKGGIAGSVVSYARAKAESIGLTQRTIPTDQLDTALTETVTDALQAAPDAVARVKKLLRALSDSTADTAAAIAGARASDQGREGLSAFLEKRKPDWTNP